jgi:hypothetical protein
MATFPSTLPNPSIQSSGEIKLAQVRTPMEAGYVQTRKKYTRSREKYSLSWSALNNTEFETLRDFFINNQGGNWDFPFLSSTKQYRFSSDSISFNWTSPLYRKVQIEIEEV